MKTISQNPDRYSKVGNSWVISANADSPNKGVTPLSLPIGVQLSNLKPLIKADGIIVKLDEDYLCSLNTLNLIKESNNPHYDIIQNGIVMVRDKEVIVGSTIKIIELNLNSLNDIMDSRDTLNLNAGAVDVVYGPETDLVDGVPQGIIDQINYTLDKVSERPADKFEVVDYFKMVDTKTNPNAEHYTIKPIRIVTDQKETIFDPLKLQTFIIELGDQLKLLKRDFNIIQDTFFNGEIPTPNISGLIIENIVARTDVDDLGSNHSVKRRESSDLVSIESNPINTIKTDLDIAKKELDKGLSDVERKAKEDRENVETQIRQGQTTDTQNQNYLARKVVELQEQIKKLQE